VEYHDENESQANFHFRPDFGATFPDERPHNIGGWVYASNSEIKAQGEGGVGAVAFDKDGNVIDYRMILNGTTMNCGGGRTPWNTWVSCEEVESLGLVYQVDPFGTRESQVMTLGNEKGRWESFSFDIRDRERPAYFLTEDHNKGTVRRFRPNIVDWESPWEMLHTEGSTDYLIVNPNDERTGGTFEWIDDIEIAKNNARTFYPQSEGIDVYGSNMYVVCKNIKQMFTFDLDTMTYFNQSTVSGLFDGGPDQMKRIVGDSGDLLYFTEEGGIDAGIHARDASGRFYTVLESPVYASETTGLSFSPDGIHLYVAYQDVGYLCDVWREDGLPFQGRTLNVKYHARRFLD
jgi:secreted PhoX family phosphatase